MIEPKRKNRIIKILDEHITNIEPSLREELLQKLLLDDSIELNRLQSGAKYVNTILGNKGSNKLTKVYWRVRGWDELTVQARYQEIKHKRPKVLSPFSREYWTNKINDKTNKNYTDLEADYERNCIRPIRKEYWMKRGFLEQEAITLAKEAKDHNNKKGANASKNVKNQEIFTCRRIEYWMIRGFTKEEAREKVTEIQTIHWKKYSPEERQKRIDKWLNTMNSKSPEEIDRINRDKLKALDNQRSISKNERLLFDNLKIQCADIQSQLIIKESSKYFTYDMYVGNKIIEYNGDFWHANPDIYDSTFVNNRNKKTANEVWDRDKLKLDIAIKHGYDILTVWENDFKHNKQEEIQKCITFLTT